MLQSGCMSVPAPVISDRGLILALSNRARGFALLAAGALLLSPSGLILRITSESGDWQAGTYRSLFMGVGALAVVLFRYRGRTVTAYRDIGLAGWASGLLLGVAFAGYAMAVLWTTVANALLVIGVMPMLIAILAWLFLGERIKIFTGLAIAVAFLGVVVMVSEGIGAGHLWGNIAALAAASGGAAAAVIWRANRHIDMTPTNAIGGFSAALITAIAAGGALSIEFRDLAILALSGTIQVTAGIGLLTIGMRYLPAAEAGLVWILESILTPVWVWVVLGEQPSPAILLGGGLVLSAVVIQSIYTLRSERSLR